MCNDKLNEIEDFVYFDEEDDDNYCPECGLTWDECECDD